MIYLLALIFVSFVPTLIVFSFNGIDLKTFFVLAKTNIEAMSKQFQTFHHHHHHREIVVNVKSCNITQR